MIHKARCVTLLVLLAVVLTTPVAGEQPDPDVSVRISAFDPKPGAELALYDPLYLRISYVSDIPIRFRTTPLRDGVELEVGAMANPVTLRPSGQNDALVWTSFSNPTRIDSVRVEVLDTEWRKIDQLAINLEVAWHDLESADRRQPPEWVTALQRKDRLKQEFVFDPSPEQKESIFDLFFLLSTVTIPVYLFLQVQFLRRWRGRWREMSAIPIISIVPMVIMSLIGFGLEFRLWVIFIFRGMPLALVYLLLLWLVKRFSEKDKAGRRSD